MSGPRSRMPRPFQTVCPARQRSRANRRTALHNVSLQVKAAVDEDTKRAFDALHALSEQEWRDWDHKTRHAWRLSFGLWGALLAVSGALLTTDYRPDGVAIGLIGALVIVLHVGFLAWIHTCLNDYRRAYVALRDRMPENVRPPAMRSSESAWYASLSLWTQVIVTLLLILLFALIASATPPNDEEYGPTNTHFPRS